jgi:iron complex transport system substrate-binding protein
MKTDGREKEKGRRKKYGTAVTASSAKRKRHRARFATLAAVVLALLSFDCGGERDTGPAGPGRPARRIISLVPAATEMLFAIGAGSQVIAVSSFDHYPPQVEKLPRVGALLDPDIERILSLRPDLVVVFEGQEELQQKLRQAQIVVFSYGRPKLADIPEAMWELGRLAGHEQQAVEAGSAVRRNLQAIAVGAPTGAGGGVRLTRVMLVIGREPGTLRNIYVSGGVGFLSDLLRLVGGGRLVNVFDEVRRENLQVTTETILAARPDVIVELVASRPWSAKEISREEHVWDHLSSLPAVRSHRIHLLVGDEFVIPGPRVVEAARRMAVVIGQP